jgi:hypothetical protein
MHATNEALGACLGNQHLDGAYCSLLMTRTQYVGESLQEFATAAEQLARCAYPGLPKDHIRRQARHPATA